VGISIVVPWIAALPFALLGLHLLRIARSSGATPDRLLAAFFLCVAAGIPPRMLGVDLTVSGGTSTSTYWLALLAGTCIGSGMVCLAAFAWKVFRPHAVWAKRLVTGFGVALFVALLAQARSLEASGGAGLPAILFNGLGALALFWSFVECVRYYRMMCRRCALGLADPVVTNRFLLWSLWTGAIGLQALLMVSLRIAVLWSGADQALAAGAAPGGPWVALIQYSKLLFGVIAPVAAVAVWLSFSPPSAYRRWLAASPA